MIGKTREEEGEEEEAAAAIAPGNCKKRCIVPTESIKMVVVLTTIDINY